MGDWQPAFPGSERRPADAKDPSTWPSPFVCTGHDRHELGVPLASTFGYFAGGVGLLALSLFTHTGGRTLGVAAGMLLVPLFVVLFRERLDGAVLEYRMWGVPRSLPLQQVISVRTARRAGPNTSIGLRAPGRRPVRVVMRAGSYAAPQAVCDHLRGWLERPGVDITPAAAALLRGRALAPQPVKRRSLARQGITFVFTVLLPVGAVGLNLWVNHEHDVRRRIPGAPGYVRYGGPHGKLLAVGRPWGLACQPVRFTVERSVPDWVYGEAVDVVNEARADGIDVTIETRSFTWDPTSLFYAPGRTPAGVPRVPIFADARSGGGVFDLGWDAVVDGDGKHEDVTGLQLVLHLGGRTGRTAEVRHAVRRLVGFAAGVSRSTKPKGRTAIAHDVGVDRFTRDDVAAIQLMSGCGALRPGGLGAGRAGPGRPAKATTPS